MTAQRTERTYSRSNGCLSVNRTIAGLPRPGSALPLQNHAKGNLTHDLESVWCFVFVTFRQFAINWNYPRKGGRASALGYKLSKNILSRGRPLMGARGPWPLLSTLCTYHSPRILPTFLYILKSNYQRFIECLIHVSHHTTHMLSNFILMIALCSIIISILQRQK